MKSSIFWDLLDVSDVGSLSTDSPAVYPRKYNSLFVISFKDALSTADHGEGNRS
jgi:hypothetical protein